MSNKQMSPVLKWIAIGAGIIVGLIVVVAVAIYAWPQHDSALQKPDISPKTYGRAVADHQSEIADDAEEGVSEGCSSKLLTHGQKTEKAVLMLHGYVACPKQFEELAQYFFDRGYNVYVPRAPDHGLNMPVTETFTSRDLAAYASNGLNTVVGLGSEIGVIGLSGGGSLATLLSLYRLGVQHMLVISPFYEPSNERLPKWQVRPFTLLYGNGILPDRVADTNTSLHYRSLAQYVRLRHSFGEATNPDLETVASVSSVDDHEIDLDLTRNIPQQIAQAGGLPFTHYQPPDEWDIGHDMVRGGDNPDTNGHAHDLYPTYFKLYEGLPLQNP